MVIALVVAFVILLVAAIVFIEAGDVLMEKINPRRAATAEMALPFLIMPQWSGDAPVMKPAMPWGPAAGRAGRAAIAEVPEDEDEDEYDFDGSRFRPPFSAPADAPAVDALAGATVIFRRPADEPVQLLPGRLTVLAGEPGREEIRFVGSIGEPAQLTLGREAGPPQRVITLHSPTVSRRHAQMDFVDGRWKITNLSMTNPVMVNDDMLSPGRGAERLLADGDQIELGEVVLRFSAR